MPRLTDRATEQMTDTETKLADARIQLRLAEVHIREYDVVRSCINGFISSARSVTFTMQKESGGSDEFASWYTQKQADMQANPLLLFFDDQRTISIHQRSVEPNQRSVNIQRIEVAGRVVGTGGTITAYEFEGYRNLVPGDSGNVFRLCRQYYTYVERLVQEWLELMNRPHP
jgi:hypothetical protein